MQVSLVGKMGCAQGKKMAKYDDSMVGDSSGGNVANRYVVSVESEDAENDSGAADTFDVGNDGESPAYTNISDFTADKVKKDKRRRRGDDSLQSNLDPDMAAFSHSLRSKKGLSAKKNKNLVMNDNGNAMPGTELGVYGETETTTFVGGKYST